MRTAEDNSFCLVSFDGAGRSVRAGMIVIIAVPCVP